MLLDLFVLLNGSTSQLRICVIVKFISYLIFITKLFYDDLLIIKHFATLSLDHIVKNYKLCEYNTIWIQPSWDSFTIPPILPCIIWMWGWLIPPPNSKGGYRHDTSSQRTWGDVLKGCVGLSIFWEFHILRPKRTPQR